MRTAHCPQTQHEASGAACVCGTHVEAGQGHAQVNSGSFKLGCLRKDPMPICASEISNTEEAAIVRPNLLVHLHSNPFLESDTSHQVQHTHRYTMYTNYNIDQCLLHINKHSLFGTSNPFPYLHDTAQPFITKLLQLPRWSLQCIVQCPLVPGTARADSS